MMAAAGSGTLQRGQQLLHRLIPRNQGFHVVSNRLDKPSPSGGCSSIVAIRGVGGQQLPLQLRCLGTYFDKKEAEKEYRRQLWEKKVARQQRLLTRRDESPRNLLKNQFQSWWNQRTTFENMLESKAKRAKMDWTIKVATVIERIPVILPDQPQWLQEYTDLRFYLDQYGKKYPKELFPEPKQQFAITDEDVIAKLPKGFTLAPRETEADLSGDVRTLNRRLKTRVYLLVEEQGTDKTFWNFPVTWVKDDETLLDASKRALTERATPLNLFCPSNCPVAVNLTPYPPDKQKELGKFGSKTFYMKLQYDSGVVKPDKMAAKDYAWLARDEVVDKMRVQHGEYLSKFYHYML